MNTLTVSPAWERCLAISNFRLAWREVEIEGLGTSTTSE